MDVLTAINSIIAIVGKWSGHIPFDGAKPDYDRIHSDCQGVKDNIVQLSITLRACDRNGSNAAELFNTATKEKFAELNGRVRLQMASATFRVDIIKTLGNINDDGRDRV